MFDYLRQPLQDYLDKTSQKLPCPGGGSVTALVGALSSALLSMAANFTVGKKAYAQYEAEIRDILRKNEEARQKLQGFIEKDSDIYERIQQASKENSPDLQGYLQESANLHEEISRLVLEILKWNEVLLTKGNKYLISDVGISAVLALATFHSARISVEINLKYIKDQEFAARKVQVFETLQAQIEPLGEKIHQAVRSFINQK